ncbi:PREDICTED: collagen alpha-1(IV) chain-like, partial [Eufriesea mexicana]|uniref:collagen alpha-1(IV) chain-like n=1 Tax=Eufriesea mexicana TaxID=516756 RepID=UPI00083C325F
LPHYLLEHLAKRHLCKGLTNSNEILQHRDAGAGGGGQSLVSPGSCLEEFRARPFIECRGLGTCNYFSTATSYWLATIKDYEMFRKPQPQTLKMDHTSRVSRCAVCLRRRLTDERIVRPFVPNGQRDSVGNIQYAPPHRYPDYQHYRKAPIGKTRGPNRQVPYHYRRRGSVRKPERKTETPEAP